MHGSLMSMNRRRKLLLILAAPVLALVLAGCQAAADPSADDDSYLFCFWNVENLFDDQEDGRTGADREYDVWFAQDREALDLKLTHLSEALLEMNDGKGPDILAVAEVESLRAAQLLREALNRRLKDESLHYERVLMKELTAGRHIAPAILTRLPVKADKTQLHGRQLRILEGHIVVKDHDLVVLATHWTSRLTDKNARHRDKYGDQIYGTYRAMYKSNPAVDLLICGDFNDPPDADSVTRHLHALGDPAKVRQGGELPYLLNLFAGKDAGAGFGTHYFGGRWMIFDQIVVSPGLLDDQGWSCDPDSVQTVNSLVRPGDKKGRPWRFGNERDQFRRGYSDHFPVAVRLKVHDN